MAREARAPRASNDEGRAFYERLGYRVVGRMPGYYQSRESALRMQRVLGCSSDAQLPS
jgi:ribosomal protein S18 acetylase RimI-like enzyme